MHYYYHCFSFIHDNCVSMQFSNISNIRTYNLMQHENTFFDKVKVDCFLKTIVWTMSLLLATRCFCDMFKHWFKPIQSFYHWQSDSSDTYQHWCHFYFCKFRLCGMCIVKFHMQMQNCTFQKCMIFTRFQAIYAVH